MDTIETSELKTLDDIVCELICELDEIARQNKDVLEKAMRSRDERMRAQMANPQPETFASVLRELRGLPQNHMPSCPEGKHPGTCDATPEECRDCLAAVLDALEEAHLREIQAASKAM